jgi:hypothetical protein
LRSSTVVEVRCGGHGDEQHWDGAADLAAQPEQGRRSRPVELDSKIGDVARWPDPLPLDDDRAHQSVERRIRQCRRLGDRQVVGLRPQGSETVALSAPPSRIPGFVRGLAADVDVDSGDLERSAAVDRQDAAFGALKLRVQRPRQSEGRGE